MTVSLKGVSPYLRPDSEANILFITYCLPCNYLWLGHSSIFKKIYHCTLYIFSREIYTDNIFHKSTILKKYLPFYTTWAWDSTYIHEISGVVPIFTKLLIIFNPCFFWFVKGFVMGVGSPIRVHTAFVEGPSLVPRIQHQMAHNHLSSRGSVGFSDLKYFRKRLLIQDFINEYFLVHQNREYFLLFWKMKWMSRQIAYIKSL